MKKKKLAGSVALVLVASIVGQQVFTNVAYAAENTVYNALSVPSGESVTLNTSPMLGMELPRNIAPGSYVDLNLEGAEWALPQPAGTLQSLYGSKDIYETKVDDARAVPYAKTAPVQLASNQSQNQSQNKSNYVYETSDKGFVTSDGKASTSSESNPSNSSLQTKAPNLFSSLRNLLGTKSTPVINAITEKHKAGLIGNMADGYDLMDAKGYLIYSYTSAGGTSTLRWTSSVPGTVTVAEDTSYGYGLSFVRKGIGSAVIKAESKNEEGNWVEVQQFTLNCPSLTDAPQIALEPLSNIATVSGYTNILEIESDKSEASIKITPSNTVDQITFTSSDPELVIQATSNLVKFTKPANLTVNKLVTVTVKTGELPMETYIVRLLANKVAGINDIIINGEGLSKIGVNAIQAISNGGAALTGNLALKTNKGLNINDKVNWNVTSSSAGMGELLFSASSIVTSQNQVSFAINGLTFHDDTPVTYKIRGYVGNDKIIEFYLYASNKAGLTAVTVQKPALSPIKVGTEYNFILPKEAKEGLLNVSSLIVGKTPSDYTWEIDNKEAATIALSGNNLTVKKNTYLSETVPVTINVKDTATGFTLYSFTIQLEVDGSTSTKITLAPPTGSPITVGTETNFIIPASVTSGNLTGTFNNLLPANVVWASSNPMLTVTKAGNDITITKSATPTTDTLVTITADTNIASFTFLVKAASSTGGTVTVDVQAGSSVTFDAVNTRFILPASASNGTLAITKPASLDASRIVWSTSEPTYIGVTANAAGTSLKLRRVGNNNTAHIVDIKGIVDGIEVLSFKLYDEGGSNIDATGSEAVTITKGNGIDALGTGFLLENYNSEGILNIAKSGFSGTTSLKFTSSKSDLIGLRLNTGMTELTVTRLAVNTVDQVATINVVINDVTAQTLQITIKASTLIGAVKPSFQVTPIGQVDVSNGIYTSPSTQPETKFNIEYSNCTESEITWGKYTNNVNMKVENGVLTLTKIPNVTISEVIEIYAKKGATVVGSFRVSIHPFDVDVDRKISLTEGENFGKGQSVDFVMTKDAKEGTLVIDYLNYSPNELTWSVDSEKVKLEPKGTTLTIKRLSTFDAMSMVTVKVKSVKENLEEYTILIPATDVEVDLKTMDFGVSSGAQWDVASSKYIVKNRTLTIQALDVQRVPQNNAVFTSSTPKITLTTAVDTTTLNIPEDFTGEFTLTCTIPKYTTKTVTFVVNRIATSEIYTEVVSGANLNIGTKKYQLTGTTGVFNVSDYNNQGIGSLVVTCSDPYVAVDTNGTVMNVVVASGYEREFSVLLTATGFDDKTLTFVPKVIIEPGIYLSNPTSPSWLKTNTREWTLPEDGENTAFVVKMNPTAVGKAKVYQINEKGISKTLPVTYSAGGTSFSAVVPSNIEGSVEHTIKVIMNQQERDFTFVFEGTGGGTEEPVILVSSPVGFTETDGGVLTLDAGKLTGSMKFTLDNVAISGQGAFSQPTASTVTYTYSDSTKQHRFVVNQQLTEEYPCTLTVTSGTTSRTFDVIFPATTTQPSTQYYTLKSTEGIGLVDDAGVLHALSTANEIKLFLQSTDVTDSLMFSSSSDLLAVPQVSAFDPVTGEMAVTLEVGLTTADKSVTVNAYAFNESGRLTPAGTFKILIPKNSNGTTEPAKTYTGALSDFVYQQQSTTIMRVTVPAGYKVSNGDILYLPMLVKSTSNTGGKVTIISDAGGTYIKEGVYNFLLSSKTGTTVKASAIKNFFTSTKVPDITISENGPNSLKPGTIKLTINEGFSFESTSGGTYATFVGILNTTMARADHYKISDNVAELEISNITGTEEQRQGKIGSLILNGLEIVRDKKNEDTGKITLKIEGAGITKSSVVIANAVAEEVSVTLVSDKDDVPTLLTGLMAEEATDETIETAEFMIQGAMSDVKKLALELTDGVLIRAVEVIDSDGIKDLNNGDFAYSEDNESYEKKFPITIDGNDIKLSDLDIEEGEETYLTLKAYVSVPADFAEKEIYVTASSSDDDVEAISIMHVENPASVVMKDTIISSLQKDSEIELPEFSLKESKAGSIDRTAMTVDEVFDSPKFVDTSFIHSTIVIGVEGFDLTTVPTIEVSEGDITLDSPKLANGLVTVHVKKNSKTASTIKVSGLKGKALVSEVPEKGLHLNIGGTAFAGNYYDGKDKDVFDTFTVDYMSYEGYILKTAKADGSGTTPTGKFAKISLDSNVMILGDGSTVTMDVTPEIKDNRTMLPLSWVGKAVGLKTEQIVWVDATRSVMLFDNGRIVQLQIGSNHMVVTDKAGTTKVIEMDVAPYIKSDRTMLPVKYLSEALNLKVEWIPETRTVIILSVAHDSKEVGVIPPALLDPATFGLKDGVVVPPTATQVPVSATAPTTGQGTSVAEAQSAQSVEAMMKILSQMLSQGTGKN